MIAGYHPHTVRSHAVPLYMRGFPALLGQDEPTMYDPGSSLVSPDSTLFEPSTYEPGGGLIAPSSSTPGGGYTLLPQTSDVGLTPTSELSPGGTLIGPASVDPQTAALAQLYQSSVAAGTMTQAQANAAIAQSVAAGAQGGAAIAAIAAGGPAPAPRVSVPVPGSASSLLTSSTIIKGIPDIALIGGGLLLAFAAMGKR